MYRTLSRARSSSLIAGRRDGKHVVCGSRSGPLRRHANMPVPSCSIRPMPRVYLLVGLKSMHLALLVARARRSDSISTSARNSPPPPPALLGVPSCAPLNCAGRRVSHLSTADAIAAHSVRVEAVSPRDLRSVSDLIGRSADRAPPQSGASHEVNSLVDEAIIARCTSSGPVCDLPIVPAYAACAGGGAASPSGSGRHHPSAASSSTPASIASVTPMTTRSGSGVPT